MLHLRENCEGSYYVPFDSTTDTLVITATVSSGKPLIILTDAKGVFDQLQFHWLK